MISIIIPALDEQMQIVGACENVCSLEGEKELIVVDGGSSDMTAELAAPYANVIMSEQERACYVPSLKGRVCWNVPP